jgi:hypothetical protein
MTLGILIFSGRCQASIAVEGRSLSEETHLEIKKQTQKKIKIRDENELVNKKNKELKFVSIHINFEKPT